MLGSRSRIPRRGRSLTDPLRWARGRQGKNYIGLPGNGPTLCQSALSPLGTNELVHREDLAYPHNRRGQSIRGYLRLRVALSRDAAASRRRPSSAAEVFLHRLHSYGTSFCRTVTCLKNDRPSCSSRSTSALSIYRLQTRSDCLLYPLILAG